MGWARQSNVALADKPVPTLQSPGNIHDPNTPITPEIIDNLGGYVPSRNTISGQNVTEKTAQEALIALLVCKRIISTKIAELDAFVRKRNGSRELINIWNSPNPSWSKYDFWEWRIRKMLEGNAYHIIQWGRLPVAVHPLDETKVSVKYVDNGDTKKGYPLEKLYVVNPDNGPAYSIPNNLMLHLVGFGYDGLKGYSPVEINKEAIGIMMAAEEYAAIFYNSGSMQSGILTTDQRLGPGEAERLKARWKQRVQGLRSAHDVVVLDAGAKFMPMTITPVEAQFLDARRYSVENIARLYGIPLPIVVTTTGQYTESVVATEITSSFLVEYGLSPWTSQIASALKYSLYRQNQRVEFNDGDIVKTDVRTESSAAVMWRKSRTFSINEIRARRGAEPLDDPRADDPLDDIGTGDGNATEPGVNDGNLPTPDTQIEPDPDISDNDDGRS